MLEGLRVHIRKKWDHPSEGNPQSIGSFFNKKQLRMNQKMMPLFFLWRSLYSAKKKLRNE